MEEIWNALIAHNLNTRGTTTDQADRLIRIQIIEQDPNVTMRWDNALDLAAESVELDNTIPASVDEDENVTIRELSREEAAINTVETVQITAELHVI